MGPTTMRKTTTTLSMPRPTPLPEPQRLAKRVALDMPCSRREAEQYIEGGWVRVEGQLIEEPQFKVAANQTVSVDPDASLMDQGPVTLLLHKPTGVDSGAQHEGGRPATAAGQRKASAAPLALDLLTPANRSKLDRSGIRPLKKHLAQLTITPPLPHAASGLLVFTQDWRVARKLLEDAETMECEVMVEVRGEVAPAQLQRLCHGLSFNGRALPPIKVSVSSQNPEQTRLRFALKGVSPGQIPSMCDDVGLHLLAIKRTRVGRIPLSGLEPGQWRYLLPHEKF
jgi:23S rRNA pseudouridine2604 synthase